MAKAKYKSQSDIPLKGILLAPDRKGVGFVPLPGWLTMAMGLKTAVFFVALVDLHNRLVMGRKVSGGRLSHRGKTFKEEHGLSYRGPETEPIHAEWQRRFRGEKAAYLAEHEGHGLAMGGTGLEPVTSCVSSRNRPK